MTFPTQEVVRESLEDGLRDLVSDHKLLFRNDANERSLTHWLAVLLSSRFQGWNVDCEYNRDGEAKKRLPALSADKVPVDSLDGPTVFPDVIVHRRNTRDNLLVVEAKKSNRSDQIVADAEKLDAFIKPIREGGLGYRYGALVVFDVKPLVPAARIEQWLRAAV